MKRYKIIAVLVVGALVGVPAALIDPVKAIAISFGFSFLFGCTVYLAAHPCGSRDSPPKLEGLLRVLVGAVVVEFLLVVFIIAAALVLYEIYPY
ncbi:hypothetical protein [Pseudacidovorax intermedius]|uniref:hypothetical protein n=1 Tax=Pseudacidovorax intermedius TaxID=433924 RepID=UPI001473B60E|nr:hypothetical protein [Pseudacidovorax intermedius]